MIDNLQNIMEFPRGFGKIFPNLMYMEVRRCHLKMLRKIDLLYYGNLRGLWLSENLLTSLPNDLFTNVQGIRHLSFFKNHLKYIGANVLTPLKHLERANFAENNSINVSYDVLKDDPSKFELLLKEISENCQTPMSVKQNNLSDLEIRFRTIENELKNLKEENQSLKSKVARIPQLESNLKNVQNELRKLRMSSE